MLRRLLTEDPAPHVAETLEAFFPLHAAHTQSIEPPIDRALIGGLKSDRVGFAFVAGYRAALQALAPSLAHDELAALCATETNGNHPRAIETRLADGRLTGRKRWTTLGGRASVLLVVASIGKDEQGRNRLRVVRVPADRVGVRVVPMSDAPFVPEIPHAEVHLDDVPVDESDVLAGDGYDAWLKPFRTVEDVHVFAALAAFLLGVARRNDFPEEPIEDLLGLIAGLRALAREAPLDPGVHLALAGLQRSAARTIERIEPLLATVDVDTRDRWQRDRSIFSVAAKARAARRVAAWKLFGRALASALDRSRET